MVQEEEREVWTGITVDHMSDEEDGMLDGKLVWFVKPPCRRPFIDDLCRKLQRRLEADPKYLSNHTTRVYSGQLSSRKIRLCTEVMEDLGCTPFEHTPSTASLEVEQSFQGTFTSL